MLSPRDPALVVGCGYLGRRVARLWTDAGRRVAALTRGRAGELAALGVEPVVGDVLDPATLRGLPAASAVLYAVGMDRTAGRSMRDVYVGGLANVLDVLEGMNPSPGPSPKRGGEADEESATPLAPRRASSSGWPSTAEQGEESTTLFAPPSLLGKGAGGLGSSQPRFIYVSSTGVYGQTDGSVVDETSPTDPVEESGRVVLEAERLLRSRRPDAIVLRFAGIYGPGRLLRRQPLLNGEPLVGDADKWLNLIHVEDGARAVLAAEERGRPGETYLVADGTPVRRRDFYTHLAKLLGGPPARFEPHPPGRTPPPEPNRRVVAAKLRRDLGFVPRFPTYVDGLAASL